MSTLRDVLSICLSAISISITLHSVQNANLEKTWLHSLSNPRTNYREQNISRQLISLLSSVRSVRSVLLCNLRERSIVLVGLWDVIVSLSTIRSSCEKQKINTTNRTNQKSTRGWYLSNLATFKPPYLAKIRNGPRGGDTQNRFEPSEMVDLGRKIDAVLCSVLFAGSNCESL